MSKWTVERHEEAKRWEVIFRDDVFGEGPIFIAAIAEIERLQKALKEAELWAETLDKHCACEKNQHNSLSKVQDRLRILR